MPRATATRLTPDNHRWISSERWHHGHRSWLCPSGNMSGAILCWHSRGCWR